MTIAAEKERETGTKESRPGVGRVVLDDLTRGDFSQTIKRDWEDVLLFYLDEEDRDALEEMGAVKRWLFLTGWIAKSLFLKLTPTRRILFLLSLFVFIAGGGQTAGVIAGFLGLVGILVLELKDKLLAQDELASGRAVQFALLPERNPVLSGWDLWLYTRPANDVGGDLVDYIVLSEDRLGVSLGDVAGKGLAAALFMAKLQATIRALAPDAPNLPELGQEINHIFWRDKLPNRFASLVFFRIGSEDGEISLLNAGHLPPLLLTDQGVVALPQGDPALGLVPHSQFAEQHRTLDRGDTLIIYSDGVTEARNEQGKFFGDARLQKLVRSLRGLGATAVGQSIVDAVDEFRGNARATDDLSLIIARRQP